MTPSTTNDRSASSTSSFHVNDLLDIARQIGGDLIEQVDLVDTFTHPDTKRRNRVSHCYRITYRSMDRSLTNDEIDRLQEQLRTALAQQLPIQLR
jgi:phenylalanyl-tRNA synthetase alpha chain